MTTLRTPRLNTLTQRGNRWERFPPPVSDNGLSFLGVSFPDPIVSRVRIEYGNSPLGPDDGNGIDVAVMDDFIYGEPVAVPEPAMGFSIMFAIFGLLSRSVVGCRP